MRRSINDRREEDRAPCSLVILGIDPGSLVTGYGIVGHNGGRVRLLGCGTIRNLSGNAMPHRLKKIYAGLRSVIRSFHPDEIAVESAFYGKNAQSALKLGHARGVALLAAVETGCPIAEYSPREVKKAVVGTGAASKGQVQYMVKSMLRLPNTSMLHDTSDALAVALCHVHRLDANPVGPRDWKSFVEAHPERVRE